jgi:HK97 family phage major capsid protein
MNALEYTIARQEEISPRIKELGETNTLTDEQRSEWEGLTSEWDTLATKRSDLEERQARALKASTTSFNVNTTPDPYKANLRELSRANVIGAAKTAVEEVQRSFAHPDHVQNVTRLIERGDGVGELAARLALTTGTSEYREAWLQKMTGQSFDARVLQRATDEYRTMTAGTSTTGGAFVPLFLDPTMVITGAGSYNPFRRVANVKTINTLIYNGGSAAQVSAGILGENVAFTDNAPTTAAKAITTYKYGAYIPASFEAFEDIDALASDVLELFRDAKDNSEATQMATGSGSAPQGILTAVGAITASRVSPATGGAYAVADVYSLHAALPARFWYSNPASKAWVASVATIDKTRQFGTANNYHGFLTDLSGGQPSQLLGDQLLASSAMSTSYTTGQDVLLYGDFSRYYIVDRIGIQTEFIPNVVDGSGLPTGTRAWLMHWRWGADVIDANAFRLLRL